MRLDVIHSSDGRAIPTICYLGYIGDSPVFVAETFSELPNELSITNFALVRESQNQGYGKLFLACLEKIAIDAGYKIMRLISHPDAYGFYIKCGYEKSGECECGLYKRLEEI